MKTRKKGLLVLGLVFFIIGIFLNPMVSSCVISRRLMFRVFLLSLRLSFVFTVVGMFIIILNYRLDTLIRAVKSKNFWINISLCIISILTIVVLLEIGCRFFLKETHPFTNSGESQLPKSIVLSNHTSIVTDKNAYKELYPQVVFKDIYPDNPRGYFDNDNTITYKTNIDGYRGQVKSRRHADTTHRVICLGDSFIFGNGLRLNDTLPYLLEKALNSKSPLCGIEKYEVLNFAVQATSTPDQLALLKNKAMYYKPNVIILFYFLNDCGGGSALFLDPNQIMRRLPGFVRCLIKRSYLFSFVYQRSINFLQTNSMIAFYNYSNSYYSPYFHKNLESIKEMDRIGRDENVRFVLAVYPVLHRLNRYAFYAVHNRLRKFAKANNIEFIDLLEAFKGAKFDSKELWVHSVDQHPNEIASRLATAYLYKRIYE